MNKREFIWLVIRFIGVFWLIMAFCAVVKIPFLGVSLFTFLPASMEYSSSMLTSLILSATLAGQIAIVLFAAYLLFYGRFIFGIVNRTSGNCHENSLRREDYVVILVRFAGVWWLWLIAKEVGRQLSAFVSLMVLRFFFDLNDISDAHGEELLDLLEGVSGAHLWIRAANIVIYVIFAWYFLKKGKLIIRLFCRRWLGENSSQPVATSTVEQASEIN